MWWKYKLFSSIPRNMLLPICLYALYPRIFNTKSVIHIFVSFITCSALNAFWLSCFVDFRNSTSWREFEAKAWFHSPVSLKQCINAYNPELITCYLLTQRKMYLSLCKLSTTRTSSSLITSQILQFEFKFWWNYETDDAGHSGSRSRTTNAQTKMVRQAQNAFF